MLRPALPLAVLLLAACPRPPSGCSPTSCAGCCDVSGICQLGQSNAACGSSGQMCTPCGAGLGCSFGTCLPGGAGGGISGSGGGSSGTGGGTSGAGGGTGQIDQELVSGSRLRALNLVGNDGSRVAFGYYFWDNQLNTYCAPAPYTYVPGVPFYAATPYRCLPLIVATEDDGRYRDPGCTQLGVTTTYLDYNPYFVDAGLPAGAVFVAYADGGVFSAVQIGNAYQLESRDGGCTVSGKAYAPQQPVSLSAFVPMTLVRD